MSKCSFCPGETAPGHTDLLLKWGEEPIQIRDVPADVCQECGEAYVGAEAGAGIDRIIRERVGKSGEVQMPVFSYEVAKQAA